MNRTVSRLPSAAATAVRAEGGGVFRTTLSMSMRDSSARVNAVIAAPATLGDAMRAVAIPFVVTRAGVLCIGLAAAVWIGYTPEPGAPSAWRVTDDPVRNLLARWDAFWYMDVATRGYHWNGNPLERQNAVFFALLPMLMRIIGATTGRPAPLAGLMVSLASFLAALCYLWRWTADRV